MALKQIVLRSGEIVTVDEKTLVWQLFVATGLVIEPNKKESFSARMEEIWVDERGKPRRRRPDRKAITLMFGLTMRGLPSTFFSVTGSEINITKGLEHLPDLPPEVTWNIEWEEGGKKGKNSHFVLKQMGLGHIRRRWILHLRRRRHQEQKQAV